MAYNQAYGAGQSAFYPSGITGWHLESATPTDNVANTNATHDSDGYYIPSSKKSTGKQRSITEVWRPDNDDSSLGKVKIGKIDDRTAVESAELACSGSDRPTLTIVGHVHLEQEVNAAKHQDGSYECEFVFPDGAYGAVDPFEGAAGGVEAYEITSSTERYSMNHQDEPGQTGKFLVGISRGVTRNAHFEATTANAAAIGDSGDTDWTITNVGKPRTNQGMAKCSADGVMYINESAG